MLVRNLRKAGDYERAILSQEENLRMAIANDRNVSQAKAQARQGMLPELTRYQMRSKEEELTDAISIQGKAQENLLSLYPKETVSKFMEGLSQDDMTYLNVYWNDLKLILKNKTGLSKTYFDRILKKHINDITDSRGMSTVPSTAAKSASLNELAEVKRLGIDFLRDSSIIRRIVGKLRTRGVGQNAAHALYVLEDFNRFLPSKAILDKANKLPEAEKQNWFKSIILIFDGINPNEAAWVNALNSDKTAEDVERLFPIMTEEKKRALRTLYAI